MRNLPAFADLRKAIAALLAALGLVGWGYALLAQSALSTVPPVAVEANLETSGAPKPLWAQACMPIVASARGERYYFAWCEGAGRLKPGNVRHFCGAGAAELAGLTLATGCGGDAVAGRTGAGLNP